MAASFTGKYLSLDSETGFKALVGPVAPRPTATPTPDHNLLCLVHESQAEAKYTQCGLHAGKRLRAPDMGWINTQSLFLHRVHWLFLRMVLYWSGNMFMGMFTLIFNDFLLHILTLPHFGGPQCAVVRLHSRLYCESGAVDLFTAHCLCNICCRLRFLSLALIIEFKEPHGSNCFCYLVLQRLFSVILFLHGVKRRFQNTTDKHLRHL